MDNNVIIISPEDTIYVSFEASGINNITKNRPVERTTMSFDADDILYINDKVEFYSPGEVVARILNYFAESDEYSGCNICIFNWWLQKNF